VLLACDWMFIGDVKEVAVTRKFIEKIASELHECPYPHVYDFSVQEETAGL